MVLFSRSRSFRCIAFFTATSVAVSASAQGIHEMSRALSSWKGLNLPPMYSKVTKRAWDPRLGKKQADRHRSKWWTPELQAAWLENALTSKSLESIPILQCASSGGLVVFPVATGLGLESEGIYSIPSPLDASVNLSTGNANQRLEIFGYYNRSGNRFSVSLYNNSLTIENGSLGYGWKLGHDVSLVYTPGIGAVIRMEDGDVMPFSEQAGQFYAAAGTVLQLVREADNSWTLTYHDQTRDIFNPEGQRIQTIDRKGNTFSYEWSNGLLVAIVDEVKRRTRFDYTNGKLTSITNPLQKQWILSYQNNRLDRVTWPTIEAQNPYHQFGYTPEGWLRQVRNRLGHVYTYGYEQGMLTLAQTPAPINGQTRFEYTLSETLVRLPEGQLSAYRFGGGLLAEHENVAGTETYFRDANTRIERRIDRRGKEWQYRWDDQGNLLWQADPRGVYQEYTYSPQNDLLTHRDIAGGITTKEYYPDGKGNVEFVEDPLKHRTTFTWTDFGAIESASDALGRTTWYEYDAYGYRSKLINSASVPIEYQNTILGQLELMTDAAGHQYINHIDPWHRVQGTSYPDKTSTWTGLDFEGRVVERTNGRGFTHYWNYDEAGRLRFEENEKGERIRYTYNRNGFQTGVTNGRNFTRTIQLNATGQPWIEDLADGRRIVYTYYPTGELRTRTNAAGAVTYGRDDAGHLTLVDYPTGVDTSIRFDEPNRRRTIIDSSGTTIEQYDAAWRSTQTTSSQGVVSNSYNEANQRISRTQSGFGGTTTWNFDPTTGQLISMVDGHQKTTEYRHDPTTGLLDTLIYANGTQKKFLYDERNRVLSVEHYKSTGQLLHTESYDYDEAGNVERKTVDGLDTFYNHDEANQLTGEASDVHAAVYSYDANGNRETKSFLHKGGVVTENYTYDSADKLESVVSELETKTYTYDAAGRPRQISSSTTGDTLFTFDYDNRVLSIQAAGAPTNTFAYNAKGARVSKTDAEGTFQLLRDGADLTASVLSDKPNRSYIQGVSVQEGAQTTYQLGGLKDVTMQIDSAETARFSQVLDAFGNPISTTGQRVGMFGSGGQVGYQTDRLRVAEDSPYQNLGHRYLDRSTGRFLTEDPARDGRNWFTYCANNPLGHHDNTGLMAELAVPLAGAGPVGWTILGVAAVGVAGYLLYSYFSSDAPAQAVRGVTAVYNSAVDLIKELIDEALDELSRLLAQLAQAEADLAAAIAAGDALGAWLMEALIEAIKESIEKTKKELERLRKIVFPV